MELTPAEPDAAAAAAGAGRGVGYRWYALGLLFAITVAMGIDRSIVPALAEPLKAEFQLSDAQFGFVAGLVYAASSTFWIIPVGALVERVNRAKLMAVLGGVSGAGALLFGAATSFLGLIVGRMAMASTDATPTSVSLLNDYFPPERRATAIGLLYSSNGVAAFVSFTLAGWIGATYGWRTACVCAGAFALALAGVALFALREPRRGAFDPPQAKAAQPPGRLGARQVVAVMFVDPTLRNLLFASVLSVFGVAGASAFTAAYFSRVHGLPLADAGLITGLAMGGASGAGAILGGFLSDALSKRSVGSGCYVVAAATLLAAPAAAGGFLSPSLLGSTILIVIFNTLLGAFYGATFSAIARAAPASGRGAVTTCIILLMNLCGFGVGPQAAGALSDLFDAAGYAQPLKWALVAISPAFLLSSLFYLLAGRSLNRAALSAGE